MALIVAQHSAVDMFPVDPNINPATTAIYAGMLVGLDATPYVAKAGSVGASGVQALGIAGDTIADEYKTTAYSTQLVIAPSGATRYTSNRVSDQYNETLASGLMTVYLGSGVFYTDQYDTSVGAWPIGRPLYSTSGGLFTTSTGTSARTVGYVLAAPEDYPSGVPGVDDNAIQGSLSLGAFLKVSLSI